MMYEHKDRQPENRTSPVTATSCPQAHNQWKRQASIRAVQFDGLSVFHCEPTLCSQIALLSANLSIVSIVNQVLHKDKNTARSRWYSPWNTEP